MKKEIQVKPTMKVVASELGKRGYQGAVSSVAEQTQDETGVKLTTKKTASELSKRGHQGAVSSLAKQMKKETGVKSTMEEATWELGKRGAGWVTRQAPGKVQARHRAFTN